MANLSHIKRIWITESCQLGFEGHRLATKRDYELADRCVGSIFDEALQPGDIVGLAGAEYELDDDLDLQPLNC